MCDGVVHLRCAVAAPANQSQHLAGAGIERNERHLRIDIGLAELLLLRVDFVHQLVHHMNRGIHCLARSRCRSGSSDV